MIGLFDRSTIISLRVRVGIRCREPPLTPSYRRLGVESYCCEVRHECWVERWSHSEAITVVGPTG